MVVLVLLRNESSNSFGRFLIPVVSFMVPWDVQQIEPQTPTAMQAPSKDSTNKNSKKNNNDRHKK